MGMIGRRVRALVRHITKIGIFTVGLLFLAGGARISGEALTSAELGTPELVELPDAPEPGERLQELAGADSQDETQAVGQGELPSPGDCDLRNAAATMAATAAIWADEVAEKDGEAKVESPRIVGVTLCMPHLPMINWYARFISGPQVKALTPKQKAHLAGRNLVDPFNIVTIAGLAAIATASNSHSPEGPGLRGFAKNVGVGFTQDMVGEFFGTFLIPSLTHEDPHYHRMPEGSIPRRILHALDQIAWTQGDDGKGMVNYAVLVGSAFEVGVNNLYVPGQETDFGSSVQRYEITLASAPIDNFITEFVPDLASHIHVRIVLVQRIINQVATTEGARAP
jgi:hypothetical protein